MNTEASETKIFNKTLKELTGLLHSKNHSDVYIYSSSVNEKNGSIFFVGKEDDRKFLYIITSGDAKFQERFDGEVLENIFTSEKLSIKRCFMNHQNVVNLQELFPFTRAIPIGLKNSFGFGDRLGLANAGHIRSLKGYNFKPIFAQQSIRELSRTNRTPDDVLDSAVWAVFQEGYKDGFGADADHLKTTKDIDLMVKAGYKTFTIDPSDYIMNRVSSIKKLDLMKKVLDLQWNEFQDSSANLIARYEGKKFIFSSEYSLNPSLYEILEACLKYNRALIHIKNICDYLGKTYPHHDHEIEVSIDETDTITTPFEHFFIVNELKRLNVNFVSLAPRFVGYFEKGIDYKGDIEVFKKEYLKHLAIAKYFGFYKISFHSGSDKFVVYNAVAEINEGFVHIKTAGTSYLEALKVVAIKDPNLFREILDFAAGLYETEKKTYHVSADMEKIKPANEYKNEELEKLFESNDVRQALHVTYGRVLTEKDEKSELIFRDRIYDCLIKNEELHYTVLVKHFQRHMNPFKDKI
ncbi:MAG: tagaturonate epimerase family protein [Ignavibacteriaceae bacterium]